MHRTQNKISYKDDYVRLLGKSVYWDERHRAHLYVPQDIPGTIKFMWSAVQVPLVGHDIVMHKIDYLTHIIASRLIKSKNNSY